MMQHLTEQQRTGALLMYLAAVLAFDGAQEDWFMHCTENYCRTQKRPSLQGAVWWSLRMESKSESLRSKNAEDWLGYLEHVCRNHRLLSR